MKATKMKSKVMYAVVHKSDGSICTHGGLRLFKTKRSATENSFPNGRIVRVEIREVPAKKGGGG